MITGLPRWITLSSLFGRQWNGPADELLISCLLGRRTLKGRRGPLRTEAGRGERGREGVFATAQP